MSPDRSLPPYPPPRVWSFPPPPVSRRWFWVAVVSVVISTLLGLALLVSAIVLESSDAPGLIDDSAVLGRIQDECDLMTAEVESVSPGAAPSSVAKAIREQNTSVITMVEQIGSLPKSDLAADRPTLSWLSDWRRLVAARESYAAALQDGGASSERFDVPRDRDGLTIDRRMEDALLNPVCEVPDVLLDPAQRRAASI